MSNKDCIPSFDLNKSVAENKLNIDLKKVDSWLKIKNAKFLATDVGENQILKVCWHPFG